MYETPLVEQAIAQTWTAHRKFTGINHDAGPLTNGREYESGPCISDYILDSEPLLGILFPKNLIREVLWLQFEKAHH